MMQFRLCRSDDPRLPGTGTGGNSRRHRILRRYMRLCERSWMHPLRVAKALV